jgi:hypothetical protein
MAVAAQPESLRRSTNRGLARFPRYPRRRFLHPATMVVEAPPALRRQVIPSLVRLRRFHPRPCRSLATTVEVQSATRHQQGIRAVPLRHVPRPALMAAVARPMNLLHSVRRGVRLRRVLFPARTEVAARSRILPWRVTPHRVRPRRFQPLVPTAEAAQSENHRLTTNSGAPHRHCLCLVSMVVAARWVILRLQVRPSVRFRRDLRRPPKAVVEPQNRLRPLTHSCLVRQPRPVSWEEAAPQTNRLPTNLRLCRLQTDCYFHAESPARLGAARSRRHSGR